ncbi:hypothetical protein VTK73DRAFT_5282 [Phialemonium thermophilum]|uniref:Uncharacterized protein n=1 Tax=Phialemonium thermophilum TaxID=223376 RepID=A0ABR3WP21_9PEZI
MGSCGRNETVDLLSLLFFLTVSQIGYISEYCSRHAGLVIVVPSACSPSAWEKKSWWKQRQESDDRKCRVLAQRVPCLLFGLVSPRNILRAGLWMRLQGPRRLKVHGIEAMQRKVNVQDESYQTSEYKNSIHRNSDWHPSVKKVSEINGGNTRLGGIGPPSLSSAWTSIAVVCMDGVSQHRMKQGD